ncbi:hypothetical protein D3C85_1057230 [compost metagenome]
MVRRMARRGHGLQGPAVALDPVAVAQDDVGLEVGVVILVHRGLIDSVGGVDRRPVRLRRQDRRSADRLGQGARQRRVVAVGVRHQDMADRPSLHRPQQGVQMRLVLGAGINDRHARARHVAPDDIGPRARKGERPRIVGDDPLDQRRDLIATAIGEVELSDVGDHGGSSLMKGAVEATLIYNARSRLRRPCTAPNACFRARRRHSAARRQNGRRLRS